MMCFAMTEERDTTMQYGVEEGAKSGFARVDELPARLLLTSRSGEWAGDTAAPAPAVPRHVLKVVVDFHSRRRCAIS